MHTLGKVIISLFFITCLIFTLSSCKKEKNLGSYRPEDFYGEWELVCKFLDTDSNGLDSGDQKYMANPKDSFTWNFLKDNHIEYKSAGKVLFTGHWALTVPNEKVPENQLFLYRDFEYYSAAYTIQRKNNGHYVIFCRQTELIFSTPRRRWYGWEFKKQ
jgi:hypothetical protein